MTLCLLSFTLCPKPLTGTHILTGIVIGGRALRTHATNKHEIDATYTLSETAKESFTFASGQATAEEQAKYWAVSSFESNSDTRERTKGGDPRVADVFQDDGGQAFSE